VVIPTEKEAACLGAAMIAAVSDGKYKDYSEAADSCVSMDYHYEPNPTEFLDRKYRQFCALYKAALDITRM
jgi:ribulose kinase